MSQRFRIFISSPGDVSDERRRAALVIGRLKREFASFFDITPVLWEYEPMLSSGHFQDIIDPPADADILVLILWSRLGTPLPESTATREYRGIDGRAPVTGTEWEFESALAARQQRSGVPDMLVYRKQGEGFARFSRVDQLDQIRSQWEALQNFWRYHFEDESGQFKAAFNRFTTLEEFETQLEQHLRELLRRRLPELLQRVTPAGDGARIEWWAGSPYRGLQAFDREHAAVFFGRERAEREITEALVKRAAENKAFMLVLGASGSGKSSLVRAGLVPDLMAPGVVPSVDGGQITWRHVIVHPADLSPAPLGGLAAALLRPGALPELAAIGYGEAELAALLGGPPAVGAGPLRVALERAAATDPHATPGDRRVGRLVLVLDQLEAAFTSAAITDEDRRALDAAVARLATSGMVWVIATLRSDFFHRMPDLPQLAELAGGLGQYQLAPPTGAEIDLIITRPAEAAGIVFEKDPETGVSLAAAIREAATRDPASLPLLSFLLDELYHRDVEGGDKRLLTYATYNELGQLEGAIARRAERLVQELSPESAAALPGLLLSLVEVGEVSAAATSRVVREGSIPDLRQQALAQMLVDARLAVADDTGQGRTFRLAHEALLSHWPRLRELIAEHRDFLIVRRRLQAEAVAWGQEDRDSDLLLPPGRRLAEAEDVLARRGADLDPETIAYVETSSEAEQDRQRRAREAGQAALRDKLRRSRRFAAAVSVLLLLAVTAGGYAWHQRTAATAARVEAENSYLLALDQAAGSLQQLVDGYHEGVVSNRLLSELVARSRKTVDGLPGEPVDVTAARVQLLGILSYANVDLGDVTAARSLAGDALALADGLAAKSPGDARWVWLQGQSRGRLSDVLFQTGDSAGAAERAREALAKLAPLVVEKPQEETVQREFMDSHRRLGLALRSIGRMDGAAATQLAWVKHAEALAASQPSSHRWRRYLAEAHEELGDTQQAQGKLAESTSAYRAAAAIASELAAGDKDNKEYLVLVTGTRLRLGDLLMQQGDRRGALAEYQISRDTAHLLSSSDPSVYGWRQGFAIAHQRIGDLHLQDGDPAAALRGFTQYVDLTLETLQRLPKSNNAFFDVANARQKVGDALREAGRLEEALGAYREALALTVDLDTRPVKNSRWRKSMANNYQRIGLTLELMGDIPGAMAAYQACFAIPLDKSAWSPRERWPEDVTDDCRARIIRAGGTPSR
ncbi:MAG: hypothetical protein K9G48_05750 [Reyranella sp.]|nr:hypothetical protein [Reyranella sp.]